MSCFRGVMSYIFYISEMVILKEYNELADRYNKLIDDKAELERKNREKAYEVMYQHEHSR